MMLKMMMVMYDNPQSGIIIINLFFFNTISFVFRS